MRGELVGHFDGKSRPLKGSRSCAIDLFPKALHSARTMPITAAEATEM